MTKYFAIGFQVGVKERALHLKGSTAEEKKIWEKGTSEASRSALTAVSLFYQRSYL